MESMRTKILASIAGVVLTGAVSVTVPVIPYDMNCPFSTGGSPVFSTQDEDLDFGEYAKYNGIYYIRPNGQTIVDVDGNKVTLPVIAKSTGNVMEIPDTNDVSKLKEVQIVSMDAAYSFCVDDKGEIIRSRIGKIEYDTFAHQKNAPRITRKSFKTILASEPTNAAIAFVASTSATTTGASSLSYSHTTSSGQNLIVTAHMVGSRTTSVTFNGVSMSLAKENYDTGNNNSASIWYDTTPDIGTYTVTVTRTTGTASIGGVAQNWTGINLSSPIGNTGGDNTTTAAKTSYSATVAQGTAGSIMLDAWGGGGTGLTFTIGAGQTTIVNNGTADPGFTSSYETDTGGGSSHTMSVTISAGRRGGLPVAEIKEEPAATGEEYLIIFEE